MTTIPEESSDSVGRTRLRVRLVPAVAEHATLWNQIRHEPTAVRFNPLDDVNQDELTRRLIAVGDDVLDKEHKTFRWFIEIETETENNPPQIVGTTSLELNRRMRHAEIGYHLAEAFFGQGIGCESVRLTLGKVLQAESGIDRVFAFISVENHASRKLVERLGFVHEGTLRDHYRIKERVVSETVYGLLRHEWESTRRLNES